MGSHGCSLIGLRSVARLGATASNLAYRRAAICFTMFADLRTWNGFYSQGCGLRRGLVRRPITLALSIDVHRQMRKRISIRRVAVCGAAWCGGQSPCVLNLQALMLGFRLTW